MVALISLIVPGLLSAHGDDRQHNNIDFKKPVVVEGKITRIVYLGPVGKSDFTKMLAPHFRHFRH